MAPLEPKIDAGGASKPLLKHEVGGSDVVASHPLWPRVQERPRRTADAELRDAFALLGVVAELLHVFVDVGRCVSEKHELSFDLVHCSVPNPISDGVADIS